MSPLTPRNTGAEVNVWEVRGVGIPNRRVDALVAWVDEILYPATHFGFLSADEILGARFDAVRDNS